MPRRDGQFLVEDFYLNTGGLNTADSPFVVDQNCATGGQNYDYIKRGGFQKRAGHTKLNSTADTEVKSLGISIWNKPGSAIACLRAAGRKIQSFDLSAYSFTNLSEDTTAAGTDFFAISSTQPVVSSMFNRPNDGVRYHAGGGLTALYGAYSATKVTKNGVAAPLVSAFTATPTGAGGTLPVGTYRYTLVFRKLSTQALSNADTTVEATATITAGQNVDLAWTLTNNDTTKYDKIYIYRSSAGGSAAFTAGSIAAIVNSSDTTYSDTGVTYSSSENVPRIGSSVLDNSVLPAGTYSTVTVFKRRLVTATGSTLYISDVAKPESWPTINAITIPSGGDITGLAVISSTTAASPDIDEILCIFKQSELWVVTGTGTVTASLPDFTLKYLANTGTAVQSLIVPVGGDVYWAGYRGLFAWNGNGKPARISQQIKDQFERGGDLDKSKLGIGFGVYAEDRNEVQWYLSSKTIGEQKYVLKLDLTLPMEGAGSVNDQKELQGKFTPDALTNSVYSGVSFIQASSSAESLQLLGDTSGFIFSAYSGVADGGGTIIMKYITPYLTLGTPTSEKRISKVIAWCLDNGAYDLELSVWSKFRFLDGQSTSVELSPSTNDAAGAVWDTGVWDASTFDSASFQIRPLVYNINSTHNSNEGDSFRLQFSEASNQYSPVIYGFSVYFTELPTRK